MTDRNDEPNGEIRASKLMWMLMTMLVVVLILAMLALRSPISQPIGERTMVPTPDPSAPVESLTATPVPEVIIMEPEDFLNPEEIGHTDGIILWSTILLIIVLVGTLRETFLRKK